MNNILNTAPSQDLLTLGICSGPTTNTEVKSMPVSFDGFVEILNKPTVGQKDGSYLTRCAFTNGTRSNQTAGQINAIVIDGDKRIQIDADGVCTEVDGVFPPELIHEVLKEHDITHVIVPSYSNQRFGPNFYKWRIWVPARLANKSELELSVKWILSKCGGAGYPLVNVPENNVVAQPWFLPRCRDEAALKAFKIFVHDGGQEFPLDEAKAWAAKLTSNPTELAHSERGPSGDRVSDAEFIVNFYKAKNLHESLNTLIARYVQRGMDERAIRETISGLMIAHDDGTERYQARIREIERSIKGAIEKFAPKPQQEPEINFDFYNYEVERPKPIEFCIDGFIADGITIIAGAPGVGKTTILVALAATVAHLTKGGIEHPALRRPAIYVTEDKRQVERELYAMKQRGLIGATADEIFKWFKIISAVRKSPEQIANMVANVISEFGTEHESGYQVKPLTVLDTISANIDLESENDNAEVGRAIAAIKQANDGAPLWLTAHTPKALKFEDVENLSVRGAGAFEGDANAIAYIFKSTTENVRFMKLGKHRYEADYSEIEFKTESFKEDVPCPWGGYQSVWYRCGLPTKSSKAKRAEYAQATHKAYEDERKKAVQDEIIARLQSTPDGTLNKTALRDRLGIRTNVANQAIGELVDKGILNEAKKGRERIVSLPMNLGTDGNE